MFLGLGGRDRDRNFSTCWPELEFAYKTLFLTIIVCTVIFIAFPEFGQYFPNTIEETVGSLQLWRLLSSFLIHGVKLTAVLNALFNLYILYVSMPDIERKYSTAYVIVQFFIHLLVNNLALVVVGYPLIHFELLSQSDLTGYGLLPLIFTFMWQRVSQTPEEPTRFCWFPCLIPMKHVPWCYFVFQIAFKNPIAPLVVYCLLGYFQFMVRKKNIILLPLAVYNKIDNLMPEWVINRGGYVKVVKVEESLRQICGNISCCLKNEDEQGLAGTVQRVEVLGGGVSIGGKHVNPQNQSQQVRKSHWRKKDEELQIERIKKQISQKSVEIDETPQFQSETIQQSQHSSSDHNSILSENPLVNQSEVAAHRPEEGQYQFKIKNDG